MDKSTIPNVEEFQKWYSLLMSSAPSGYIPWLFVLEPKGKDPLASRPWAVDKSRLSFDEAIRWLEYGHNIGISARDTDELVLVDVDNMNAIPEEDVKPTLSVITRSRVGMHHYYFSDAPECICNIPTEYGEMRSCNQYLVCPGSFVTTDCSTVPQDQKKLCGYYTVHNAATPVSITFDELPKVFRDHHTKMNRLPAPDQHVPSEHRSKSALFDLTIYDIVSYPKTKARFSSVFHGSDSGANTSVSNGLLHCFRHLVSHNAIQALAVLSGMYTCQQAGKSHLNGGSGPSMVNMRDEATAYTIWQYARENGYIPKDDVPPSPALRYFVIGTGICKVEDLEDGWKIPTHAYREGRRLLCTNV